jgi:hypothetical protein
MGARRAGRVIGNTAVNTVATVDGGLGLARSGVSVARYGFNYLKGTDAVVLTDASTTAPPRVPLRDQPLGGGAFVVPKEVPALTVEQGARIQASLNSGAARADFIGPRLGRSGFITSEEFAQATFERYQGAVNAGHARATAAEARGLLRGNPNTRVGTFVDDFSSQALRRWLRAEGISEGPGNMVELNRWLRDPSGSGSYVRPDVRLPGSQRIYDATVGFKPLEATQIQRFLGYSRGDYVTIVRPDAVGGSYSFVGK